jgi:hypothetical protein
VIALVSLNINKYSYSYNSLLGFIELNRRRWKKIKEGRTMKRRQRVLFRAFNIKVNYYFINCPQKR